MTEDIEGVDDPLEAVDSTVVAGDEPVTAPDEAEVTVWAPEPSLGADDVVADSVDEWIKTVNFESTEDVPIPDRLVDHACTLNERPPSQGCIGRPSCLPKRRRRE